MMNVVITLLGLFGIFVVAILRTIHPEKVAQKIGNAAGYPTSSHLVAACRDVGEGRQL